MRRGFILLLLFLAACGTKTLRDEKAVQTGETLYTLDFESPDQFEIGNFADTDSNRPFDATLQIENGVYQITYNASSSAYIWGQGGNSAQAVDIAVDVKPLSDDEKHFYGVMCRVDDNGAGYVFLISSDGYGGIATTDGQSLSFIADWRESNAIKKGETTNQLRAVCVEDYLALYVNDTLVADAEDKEYGNEGQVGLVAGILTETREPSTITVEFDNLVVSQASLSE